MDIRDTVLRELQENGLIRLDKTWTTGSTLASGGLLSSEEEKAFFTSIRSDYIETLKRCQWYSFASPDRKVHTIDASRRQTRKHTENTDASLSTGTTTTRTLTPTFIELAWAMTDEFKHDNVERDGAEQTLDKMFGNLFATDMADLAWIGDANTGGGVDEYAFKRTLNGWRYWMNASSAVHDVDLTGSTDVMGVLLPAVITAMPMKYKKMAEGKPEITLSSDLKEIYLAQWRARTGSARGDQITESGEMPSFDGYKVVEDIFLPEKEIVFCSPKNLSAGNRTNVTRFESDRSLLKGAWIYVLRAYLGTQLRDPDGIVWGHQGAYVAGQETL